MSIERCELSDLPVDQCACRTHRPGQEADAPPARPAGYGPEVVARYPGRCPACHERYEVGEPIRVELTTVQLRSTGSWLHSDCAEA